jgi:hypothetical protein
MASHEVKRIADQLNRAVNGRAWHGPAILPLVRGVSAKQASARPIAGAHSIREIVVHAAAWLDIVRQRLEGNPPRVTAAMDWPTVAGSSPARGRSGAAARGWRADVARLRRAANDLQTAILSLDDRRLAADVPTTGDAWSGYNTLHGVVQHLLYHAGQIAILKKGAT